MTAPTIGGWFAVPKGALPAECRYCRATIYWIRTKNDKAMPIDCEVAGATEPSAISEGAGVSHFATCSGADRARKTRR